MACNNLIAHVLCIRTTNRSNVVFENGLSVSGRKRLYLAWQFINLEVRDPSYMARRAFHRSVGKRSIPKRSVRITLSAESPQNRQVPEYHRRQGHRQCCQFIGEVYRKTRRMARKHYRKLTQKKLTDVYL